MVEVVAAHRHFLVLEVTVQNGWESLDPCVV